MATYSLIAPIAALMQPRNLPKVGPVEAVRQHIDLLLASRLGECRYDPERGSAVWQGDFAAITNQTAWKGDTEAAIANLIQTYEKRLRNARVSVDVEELEETDRDGHLRRTRKRLTIHVNATLIAIDEALPELIFTMYVSPVASE